MLDVTGSGTIQELYVGASLVATIYIDNDIFIQTTGNGTTAYTRIFGVINSAVDAVYKLTDTLNLQTSTIYTPTALNFKKSLKVVVKDVAGNTSRNSIRIIYGIGGAAQ